MASTSTSPLPSGRHISGTSRHDLPRSDENRRDLSRRSNRMRGAFALVRETPAQDPAYRPAHPPSNPLTCGAATDAGHSGHMCLRASEGAVERVTSAAGGLGDQVALQAPPGSGASSASWPPAAWSRWAIRATSARTASAPRTGSEQACLAEEGQAGSCPAARSGRTRQCPAQVLAHLA